MELLTSLYITAGTWGFGLLLTAIIQTAQHQLSLFHAIFILHMLSFLGIGVAPMGKCSAFSRPFVSRSPLALSMPAGKYHLTRTRVAMVFLVQYVSLTSFIAWGLYLWVNVKHYGSQPECNHQIKYVVFFFTVRATANWLRRLWIAMFSILCLSVLLGWFATLATIIFAMKRTNEEEEVEEMNSWSHVVDYSYFKVDTTRLLYVGLRFSLSEHS
jgi:hypothetical protein